MPLAGALAVLGLAPGRTLAEPIVDGNWTLTCASADQGGRKQCSAILTILQTDKSGAKHVVFSWVLGRHEGKLESILSVPTGVLIQPGVEVTIGDKETRKLVYSLCAPDHCEALLPLDDMMVKSLGAAQVTEVTVYGAGGGTAKFAVQMKGFAQALADLGK